VTESFEPPVGDPPVAPHLPERPRRATIAFIFVTILIDVMAMGLVIPVLPPLVQRFLHGDTAQAAEWIGIFGTAWSVMQFICSPILGSLSDHFGRRPVILAANFGLGLDFILMALAPSIPWLFVGRIISGITGASFTTAWAYIADVTPPEKRAAGFGVVGAAWGVGFVLGPALGGLLGVVSPRLPFWVAAGLALVNVFYGFFVLPESLAPDKRTKFSWRRANPVGSLALLRSNRELLGLATVFFLYFFAQQAMQNALVLSSMYRFGWNERSVGLMLSAMGASALVVQALLVSRVVARFGERRALLIGLTFGMLGEAIFGLARTGFWFCVGVPILTLQGLTNPSIQGLMTRRVSAGDQGKLQGANTSVLGLTGLIGPAVYSFTFAHFIRPGRAWTLPGAPFLLASLVLVVALAIAMRVTRIPDASKAHVH
jgi:DHA1 family tetracycline resistance protein-like MFS transporter